MNSKPATSSPTSSKPARFTDMMDPSRILQPIEVRGRRLLCKVYFKGSGGVLTYSGKVELSAHLFDQNDRRNAYIGFMPESADVEPLRPQRGEHRTRRDYRDER